MASRNIVIKNNTRCFKSPLQKSLDFSFLKLLCYVSACGMDCVRYNGDFVESRFCSIHFTVILAEGNRSLFRGLLYTEVR